MLEISKGSEHAFGKTWARHSSQMIETGAKLHRCVSLRFKRR